MQLDYLKYFLQVAQDGSISKAAKNLYLKQSNLSKIIQLIEKEFQTDLFLRQKKGVVLTNQGREVKEWAEKFLLEKELLEQKFNNKPYEPLYGEIKLFTSMTINGNAYSKIINTFLLNNPNVSLKVEEISFYDVPSALENSSQAIAHSIFDKRIMDNVKQNPALVFYQTSKIDIMLYASKNCPLIQNYRSISIKNLLSFPLIIYNPQKGNSTIRDFLNNYGESNIVSEISNLITFYNLLETGNYVTIGVRYSSSSLEQFHSIPVYDVSDVSSGLLFKKEEIENPLVKALINEFCKYYKVPFPFYNSVNSSN